MIVFEPKTLNQKILLNHKETEILLPINALIHYSSSIHLKLAQINKWR